MSGLGRKLWNAFLVFYLILVHSALAFFAFAYFFQNLQFVQTAPIDNVSEPLASTPVPTPIPVPSEFVNENPQAETPQPTDQPADVLMIPVKGVKRSQLVDTFTAARTNGRVHDAIDIMAPQGTPVLAAVDGEIIKFFDSVAGGITIYEASADQKYIYYYAHLQRRADDVKEHDRVARGRVIGYVGDTGNAGPGNYHLHFAISLATDPKRWWDGTYINPYPILKNGIETP